MLSLTSVFAVAIAGIVIYGLTRTFTDANMMPILCLIADRRIGQLATACSTCFPASLAAWEFTPVVRCAPHTWTLSKMFLFVFTVICVCAVLLFSLKPKATPQV